MIGEVDIGGVFVPALLLLALLAAVVTAALSRLLALVSAYRFISYRPLVDAALFVVVLALLVFLIGTPDPTP